MKRLGTLAVIVFILCSTTPSSAFAQKSNTDEIFPVQIPFIMNSIGLLKDIPQNKKDSSDVTAPYSIPGTNQSLCYGATASMECPAAGAAFYGQDATYDRAPLTFTTFSGITSDSLSRYWSAPGTARTYSDAAAYCASITDMSATWRLPTLTELSQIVDASLSNPAVDTSKFTNMQSAAYWAADASGATDAWVVDFTRGATSTLAKTSTANTICVTAYMEYDGYLAAYPDGTVANTKTKTMWQKADGGPADWQSALNACEQSNAGGYTDWRLPTKNEIQSMVEASSSSLWPSAFTSHAGNYWSSTTVSDTPTNAWTTASDKHTASVHKTLTAYYRCVRSMAPLPLASTQTIMSGTWNSTVNGASVVTRLVNVPSVMKATFGGTAYEMTSGALSAEATVTDTTTYSYHPTGSVLADTASNNVMLVHSGSPGVTNMFTGTPATVKSVTGDIKDQTMAVVASGVTATRANKASTQQNYDISGLWTGTALGAAVAADLRSATYTATDGQTVAYFNGAVAVPYGNNISPYTFTGFMESDGTVFMVRNTTSHVYIFEGTRSGDTITGTLRDFDDVKGTGLVFTRVAGSGSSGGGPSGALPLLLFGE